MTNSADASASGRNRRAFDTAPGEHPALAHLRDAYVSLTQARNSLNDMHCRRDVERAIQAVEAAGRHIKIQYPPPPEPSA